MQLLGILILKVVVVRGGVVRGLTIPEIFKRFHRNVQCLARNDVLRLWGSLSSQQLHLLRVSPDAAQSFTATNLLATQPHIEGGCDIIGPRKSVL
jgi:hypothetical protein